MIEIKSWITGQVLYKSELSSLKEAVIQAAKDGADLRHANFTSADLTGADLRHANFTSANLTGADLRHANLTGADLRHADLTGADLRHADLTGADLRHANLRHANLNNAVSPSGNSFLTSQLGNDQIIAISSDDVRIGCEVHSITHWMEHYAAIGKEHTYKDFEIEDYGEALRLFKKILERRESK